MTRSVKSSGCFLERASSDDPNHNHARDKARSLRERGLARNSAPSSQTPRPHRGVVTILAGLAPFIIHPDDFRVALPIGTKFDPVEMWRGRGFALDRATAPLGSAARQSRLQFQGADPRAHCAVFSVQHLYCSIRGNSILGFQARTSGANLQETGVGHSVSNQFEETRRGPQSANALRDISVICPDTQDLFDQRSRTG